MRIASLLEQTRASALVEQIGLDSSSDNPDLASWLRRPEASIERLRGWISVQIGAEPVHGVLTTVETEFKYAGYIAQQEKQIKRLQGSENRQIPEEFNYEGIPGLSKEIQQKLGRVRPVTLGQARRIPGVTPAAIAIVDVYLTMACFT